MKKILSIIKNKWLRKTAFTILLVAVVIAVYMAINLWVRELEITDIDLTEEGFYSLSDESKEQLKNVDEEINIYIFGYEENSSVVDLAKQYSKYKENITVEVVSVEDRPDLATEYDIDSTYEENYLPIVFVCEGRSIIATCYDLYTYDYNTYEYIDLTEQKLTNSILAVTLVDSPKVYFLTGHSEYGLSTYFQILSEALESEVYELESLDLLVTNEVPEDCNVLVIPSPSTDFTDYETELIIDYINNGGNILYMSDYTGSALSNVQKILDMYGVTIYNDGIVLEQDTSAMLMQTPDAIIPTVSSSSEITSAIASSGKVVLIDSGKIEVEDDETLEELGVTVTELLTTSDEAFYRTDLTIGSTSASSSEETKSYVLGAVATKTIETEVEEEETEENDEESEEEETTTETVTSELVIYANCIFATDYPITVGNQSIYSIYFYNNEDLILNSISYLAERTETITIRKTYSSISYTATEQEDLIVKFIIFIAPLVIIAIGLMVWRTRRHMR